MPTYTYSCTSCNGITEKRQSFSDVPLTVCEACGGALRKVIHPVGIVFKGSGWYSTDSRKSTSSSVNANGEAKGETEGKADGKTEGKADSKAATASSEGTSKPAETKAEAASAPAATTPAAKKA